MTTDLAGFLFSACPCPTCLAVVLFLDSENLTKASHVGNNQQNVDVS